MDEVKQAIREVPNVPKPGIGFKDITPVIQDARLFSRVIEVLTEWAAAHNPDIIVGIESRGFLFAAPVAIGLKKGMALIRKKGKLPFRTVEVKAPNEYAEEIFQIHVDAVKKGERVVIIDDLIATGWSSISAIELVKKLAGRVLGFGALVDLSFLNGVPNIKERHPDVEVKTLIQFE
ncbi:MAG: adenine phosphoribosyltransferase [Candidatus Aminicenantes bacterium]|nr:adenine phosphoribosyltransferase [Candidatus Aminicenantes bacterium]